MNDRSGLLNFSQVHKTSSRFHELVKISCMKSQPLYLEYSHVYMCYYVFVHEGGKFNSLVDQIINLETGVHVVKDISLLIPYVCL